MTPLVQDLRFGYRSLKRGRVGTLAMLCILAVAIGINSVLFTLFNVFFLAPLPGIREDPRLTWVHVQQRDGSESAASYPEFYAIGLAAPALASLAAFATSSVTLGNGPDAEAIPTAYVTGRYFGLLGVRPVVGRLLQPDDDSSPASGGSAVGVISERLWRRRFGADPAVIGRSVRVGSTSVTLVGVAGSGFAGPLFGVPNDLWLPLSIYGVIDPEFVDVLRSPSASILQVLGRLERSASVHATEVAATRSLANLPPDPRRSDAPSRQVRLARFRGGIQDARRGPTIPLAILGALLSGLILLVVATNVGGIQLARSLNRHREFGIRVALGASRTRIIRQLVTESVLLWTVAGIAGFLLAWGSSALARATVEMPPHVQLSPNLLIFGATLALALLCGVLFGLGPALVASSTELTSVIKQESGTSAPGRAPFRGLFIVCQLAVTLILLTATAQVLSGLRSATSIDPGFDASERVLTIFYDAKLAGVSSLQRQPLNDELLRRVRARPGVLSASIANTLPLGATSTFTNLVPSTASGDATSALSVAFNGVRPDYFRTIGTSLVRGRDFSPADREGAPRVAVVNEVLARRLWPGRDPIGQRFRMSGDRSATGVEVIGVARDAKYASLDEPPTAFFYLPSLQNVGEASGAYLLVRAATSAERLAGPIREDLMALDPRLAATERHETLGGYLRARLAPRSRGAAFVAMFGLFALALAAVGIYGAASQFVAQRTREFGIRMALGADARHITRLVLSEGLRIGSWGVITGVFGAGLVTRLLGAHIMGVSQWSLPALAGMATLLLGIIALAAWLPARHATRISPMLALRHE